MFEHTSRYYALDIATFTMADGRLVKYVRRRLLPPARRLPLLGEVTLVDGDRLDTLAAKTLSDPEQYWRICDANGAMRPAEVIARPGAVVRIPVPQVEDPA